MTNCARCSGGNRRANTHSESQIDGCCQRHTQGLVIRMQLQRLARLTKGLHQQSHKAAEKCRIVRQCSGFRVCRQVCCSGGLRAVGSTGCQSKAWAPQTCPLQTTTALAASLPADEKC